MLRRQGKIYTAHAFQDQKLQPGLENLHCLTNMLKVFTLESLGLVHPIYLVLVRSPLVIYSSNRCQVHQFEDIRVFVYVLSLKFQGLLVSVLSFRGEALPYEMSF